MRRTIITLGMVATTLLLALASAWTADTDPVRMRARYEAPNDRYAHTDGMAIRYRVTGPAGAPLLILLHGTGGSLEVWEAVRDRLDDRYRVVAYDHPGHGLTGPHSARDYDHTGFADGLRAVMAAVGADEAVLVGHSLGGWTAWTHAVGSPDDVTALVLIAPSGLPVGEDRNPSLGFRLARNPVGRLVLSRVTPRAMVRASAEDSVADPAIVTEAMVDRYWEMLRYPGNRMALADQVATDRTDLSACLSEITAPVLLLWGDRDGFQPLATVGRGFEDRITGADLIVYEGVGHLPMVEVPAAVARDVAAFVDETTP